MIKLSGMWQEECIWAKGECENLHKVNPGYIAKCGSLESPNKKFKQGENWLIKSLLFGETQL